MTTWYPPPQCPICGSPVHVKLASVTNGEVHSWRDGLHIYPNFIDMDNYEVYDSAWCSNTMCQIEFHVEGR